MTSKQDDNFDLYDDPYAATGGNGGADPYAEDDDDYYNSSHVGDRGRGGYDDAEGKDGERSRFQNTRDGPESRPSDHSEEHSAYGQQKSLQSQHKSPGHSQDTSDATGGYDPAQPYHQQPDSSYQQQQQQPQQSQQQHLSQYSRSSQQGSSNYSPEAGSYQQARQPQQQQQSQSSAGREHGKMFIGGLNWETTDESLKAYFSRYGELTDCMVMKDPVTSKSRGFGFLTFLDPKNVDAVLKEDHYLDGKMIDPKRAIPREEQEKTEKIFVGGIAPDVTEEEFANYFSQFGHVLDATLMLDRSTGRPRGFGFITFESDRGVEAALSRRDLMLHDKPIEVKRAQPKHRAETRGGAGGFSAGGFGGGQGGFGGYGGGQGAYGGNMGGGGRNFGMESMGAMMGGGGFGGGFGGGAGAGPDPYQAMGAYAAAAARFGANPAAAAAAAALAQRYRMAAAAAAAAYGSAGGSGAGGGGAGMGGNGGGGGYDPTVALSAFYRQPFAYGGAGAGNNGGQSGGGQGGYGSNSNGSYGDQESGSGNQSSQRRHGGQSGTDGASGHSGGGGSSSSSYGANGGYESRGGGGSSQSAGRSTTSGSGGARQGGAGSGSSGPVRGGSSSGGGSTSSGGHGRGGGSYHPYQR